MAAHVEGQQHPIAIYLWIWVLLFVISGFSYATDFMPDSYLRWGLIPAWVKDPKAGPPLINARAETVATKPSFRSALKNRRCIVRCSTPPKGSVLRRSCTCW